jgi:MFS family permease
MKFRLCVMMFLQFFIWGAWYPLVFDYVPSLGFNNDWQVPLILGAFNLSALIAMFFSNQFVDRTFAAEKFLAFSHLVGGAAMIGLTFIRRPDPETPADFWPFFGLMLLHTLFYVPTISITNAIAFANLKDPSKEFGFVRLWGTIGWIAAAWPFVFILVDWAHVPSMDAVGFTDWFGKALGTPLPKDELREATRFTFTAAGAASIVLAAFSLVLPHTPPKPSGEPLAWLEAMKHLAKPFLFVLFVVTFLDAAIHQAYFYWAANFLKNGVHLPGNWVMPVMSIGQIAEVATMAVLGYVLKTLGWRFTMVIGILGHAGRFAVFAFAGSLPTEYQQPAAIIVNILHGICYAFFFATLYIFIDEYFPKDARASAQGLFNMLILGVGPFVSNFVSGRLNEFFATARDSKGAVLEVNFRNVFLVPTATALVAALLLMLFFHPPRKAGAEVPT